MPDSSPLQQDGSGAVNWTAALEATDGDEELLLEIVKVFIDEAPSAISGIRKAINECDAELLRRSAHILKGSLRIFGSPKAAHEYAWQIEQIGAKADPKTPPVEEVTPEDWNQAEEILGLLSTAMSAILAIMEQRATG